MTPANQAALQAGTDEHAARGRGLGLAGWLRRLAWGLALTGALWLAWLWWKP